jgi:hypothetical protein
MPTQPRKVPLYALVRFTVSQLLCLDCPTFYVYAFPDLFVDELVVVSTESFSYLSCFLGYFS